MDETRTRTFPLRIFGLGCPSDGAAVTAHIENEDFLIIQSSGGIRPIPLVKLMTRLQGNYFVIEWEQNKEPYYACLTLSPSSTDQKSGWSPSSWESMLKLFPPPSSHHQIETTGWFGLTLFMLLGVSAVVFVCYWVFYKDVVNITSRLLPLEMEQQLAEPIWQQRSQQLSLIQNTHANAVIDDIAKKLNQSGSTSYHYRWYVSNQPDVAIESLLGGYMVIHRGVLENCQSADELAGMMAHEMAHAETRDSLRQVLDHGGIKLVWALIQANVTAAQVSEANSQLGQIEYQPEHESEMDQQTLLRLQQAQISSAPWREFFDRLQRQQTRQLPPLLFNHPISQHRLPDLQKNRHDFAPLNYDWQAVTASLAP